MTINWDDPAARAALIEKVGADEYNRLFDQHVKSSTVAIINGHRIRPFVSQRWGKLYRVDDTGVAFPNVTAAAAHARALPAGSAS